jgi:hypothetical protein
VAAAHDVGLGGKEPESRVRVDSVRSTPSTGPFFCIAANTPFVPKPALSSCNGISKRGRAYSITSSARASSDGGTVILSALAVLRLITSSNLAGCWIGISAGLPPLMIWST